MGTFRACRHSRRTWSTIESMPSWQLPLPLFRRQPAPRRTFPCSRSQGLLLLSSPLIAGNPQLIADLAVRRNLPTISLFPEIARAGGLIGYGPVIQDLFRQVGGMARKVLQGAKVAELPAERPTRFQLVANLKTAKLIGITLPSSILLRADEVIE